MSQPDTTTEQNNEIFYNDLHADVEAAFAKAEEQASEAVPIEEMPTETIVEQPEEINDGEEAAETPQAETVLEKTQENENDLTEEEPTSHDQMAPPQFFKKEFRERWAELAPEWQQYLTEYEQQSRDDYQKKTRELAEEKRQAQGVFSTLEPYKQQWATQGLTPDQAVAQSLAITHHLNQSPKETLAYLAQQYGIDFNEPEDYGSTDPKVQQLEQKVTAFEQAQLQQAQQQQQQMMSNLQAEISAFEVAKNTDGSLLHPHFQEVRGIMQPYVEREWQAKPHLTAQQVMKEAYEQAIWAHAPTREKLLTSREPRQTTKEAKSKAQTARVRGSSINGAPVNTKLPEPTFEADTVAEAVEAAWKQLNGGM